MAFLFPEMHTKHVTTLCGQNVEFGDANPLNAKLNPICHLLALLGAHHILHVSRIRVKKSMVHNVATRLSKIKRK